MRILLVAALISIAFAGCIGDDADVDSIVQPLPLVGLDGQVLTPNFNPIEGAVVAFDAPQLAYTDGTTSDNTTSHTITTDAGGNFSVTAVAGVYTATVTHPDYQDREVSLTIPSSNLTITLQPALVDIPFNEGFDFNGHIQCALEALIITPSCDTLLGYPHEQNGDFPDISVFQDDSVFELTTPKGWQTFVLDVTFDGSAHPGIAGLRTSAYAADADAEVLSYQRITQKWAPGSFTLRVDAGQDYGDAAPAPDSDGGDGLRFEFYPQGHGDDTVCTPDAGIPFGDTCFLGAGFGQDVTFTAKATVFVHEPAPQGWTSFAQG